MKRILCLWLPEWPLQRLFVAHPELKDQAVVLHARDARRGEYVVACSPPAQALGIHPGMSLADASAWAQPSARRKASAAKRAGAGRASSSRESIRFQRHEPAKDRNALEDFARQCERFSPRIGLDHPQQAEGLWLEITGLAARWGGESALAQQVLEMGHQQGYLGQIAIADTLGAAWGLVRYGRPTNSEATSWSIHSNEAPRDPHNENRTWPVPLCIAPGETKRALRSLPIQALRLSESTIQLLQRLGIERIEQLLDLPRAGLAARLGKEVLQRWDQATGELEEVLLPYRSPVLFQAQWDFEFPTTRQQVIEHAVQHVCHHLTQQLMARNQGALQVCCRLVSEACRSIVIEVGLFRPTVQTEHLFQLLRMQLEVVKLPGPVHAVHLWVPNPAPLSHGQASLWNDFAQPDPQQLAQLIDRLSSRLGAGAVLMTRLRARNLPEEAYTTVPLTGPGTTSLRSSNSANRSWIPQPHQRPLQLLDPPQLLEGMWVAPEGPPISFQYQGHTYHVRRHWGPERIETAWWQGSCVRRDYYRVECTTGNRFWLFRHLTNQCWFLHGQFE